jgi:hypothetical protein
MYAWISRSTSLRNEIWEISTVDSIFPVRELKTASNSFSQEFSRFFRAPRLFKNPVAFRHDCVSRDDNCPWTLTCNLSGLGFREFPGQILGIVNSDGFFIDSAWTYLVGEAERIQRPSAKLRFRSKNNLHSQKLRNSTESYHSRYCFDLPCRCAISCLRRSRKVLANASSNVPTRNGGIETSDRVMVVWPAPRTYLVASRESCSSDSSAGLEAHPEVSPVSTPRYDQPSRRNKTVANSPLGKVTQHR